MRRCAFVLALMSFAACGDKDETAPPAPNLDPVESPTSVATQLVQGSAEFGSTVRIEGGQGPVEVKADPFTARFRAQVALVTEVTSEAGAETQLTVTARDAAGNTSEPAHTTIVYRAARVERLTLGLSRAVISADDGSVTARARVESGRLLDLSGFQVSFEVSGVDGAPTLIGTTDASGIAEVSFDDLREAAPLALVRATALTNNDAFDTQPLTVAPGAATTLDFALAGDTVEAGTELAYSYMVEDAHGNAAQAPVVVTVDHPGAEVLDDHVSGQGAIIGLTQVRDQPYVVTARVFGSELEEHAEVSVDVATGSRSISLALSVSNIAVDDTVAAFAVVEDRFGNPIHAPAPTFSLARSDGSDANGVYTSPSGDEFTIGEPDIYRVTATFDDGENTVAVAHKYVIVEATPDLQAPEVAIVSVNGFAVCDDGTLEQSVPGDCTDTTPAVEFQRNSVVVVRVQVTDDRELSEVSYKAFGSGVSRGDYTLVGAGSSEPGTPLELSFAFQINGSAVPGDAWVVAQAKDASGNTTNSKLAALRIDLGIVARGGRTLEPVVVDNALAFTRPYDVAVSGNTIYVTNRDDVSPLVYRIDGQTLSMYASFPQRPEFIHSDSGGNLFVSLDGSDELWKVAPGGASSVYQDQDDPTPPSDPEGMSVLDAATPATGRFLFANGGSVADQNCVDIAGQTYEFDTGGGTNCAGAAGNCGQAFDVCVAYNGSLSGARSQLAAAINQNSGVVAAFEATSCGNGTESCVFLVAKTAGSGISVALSVPNANDITRSNVAGGQAASLLYVVDANGFPSVLEYQVPAAPGAAQLQGFDLNGQPRGVTAALRGSATSPWLQLLVVDDSNDELRLYDSGSARRRVVADQNDGIDQPFDVEWSASGCALVANRGSGEVLAIGNIDGPGANSVELIADGFNQLRGIALEGSGASANLLVVDSGYNVLMRITPSAASGDCF